jgi:hypothetical protein
MSACLFCNKSTNNPKFCCRSCAASYNNKTHPKRKKKQHFCLTCGKEIEKNSRKRFCDEHNKQLVDWSKVIYSDEFRKRKYQKNSKIRSLARSSYMKSDLPRKCALCGYNKHFHVCHRKSISQHDDRTPISEINKLSNLIALCPNHHWELDNGLLSLDFPEFDHLHL